MTVAMAVAEKMHHSSRRQTNARSRVWGEDPEAPHTPSRSSSAFWKSPAGPEVAGWQERVQPHYVEHLANICSFVRVLGAPVPRMVDQFAEILNLQEDTLDAGRLVDRFFQVPELIIEVPKIILDDIPTRTSVPEPQTAEQLVEVPAVLSVASLQLQTVEQPVDASVPHGRGKRSLHGFPPELGSTAQSVEQMVDIFSGDQQDFHLGQGSTASSCGATDEAFTCFFRTLPLVKKSATQPPHSNPWTPAASAVPMVLEEEKRKCLRVTREHSCVASS